MKKTLKYIVCNRFMWLYYAFALVLLYCLTSANPYINEALILLGVVVVCGGYGYIDEECKLNAQERLFKAKLGNLL